MQWYSIVAENLSYGKTYTHKDIISALRNVKPNLSANTYHWAVSHMVRDGQLTRVGYGEYSLSVKDIKPEYRPYYSETALDVIRLISERFPHISFTVFETSLLNDFLNHLVSQNTIYVQVEKESSVFVFRFLQEAGYHRLMYLPSKRDYSLYWANGSIIVTNLISEAPMRSDDPHRITLEKMLVDMCSDKLISSSYSMSELPDVFKTAQNDYCLDRVRLYRYARRRNKEDKIKQLLREV